MRSRRDLPVLALPGTHTQQAPALPAMSADEGGGGISLPQILSILLAYWKLSLLIIVVVSVIGAVVIKFLPKKYTATATLIVNYEINDPLSGKEFPIGLLNSYMTTQIEIIQSSSVLLPMIDRLKLTENKEYAAGYVNNGSTLRDYIKDKLQKDIQVTIGNQLLYISAVASTPTMAAAIANGVADTYSDQQLQRLNDPAAERAARYATQLAELKNKVAQAQAQVTAYRQRTGVTDIVVAGNDVDTNLLTSLEQRYQEAQNLRRAAEVKQGAAQLNGADARASAVIQSLRQQLVTNQSTLAQMRATLGPKHPKVVELQSQIDSIQHSLNDELKNVASGSQDDLKAARELEEKMRRAVEEQRAKVVGVRNVQDDGTKLVLELESAQSLYKRALDGYDQIMVAAASHYSNVGFISRAEPPMKSTKPNKMKLLVAALAGAVMLGLLGPFAYELFINRRIRCRDDLERDLGLNVLVEFHALPLAEATT